MPCSYYAWTMLFPGLCIYFADVALRAGQMNNLTPLNFQNMCKEDTVLTVQMATDKVDCRGAHAKGRGGLEGGESQERFSSCSSLCLCSGLVDQYAVAKACCAAIVLHSGLSGIRCHL